MRSAEGKHFLRLNFVRLTALFMCILLLCTVSACSAANTEKTEALEPVSSEAEEKIADEEGVTSEGNVTDEEDVTKEDVTEEDVTEEENVPAGENHQLSVLTGLKSKYASVYDKQYETDEPGVYSWPEDIDEPDSVFVSLIESCVIPDEETAALFPEFAAKMQEGVDSIDERLQSSYDYCKENAYEMLEYNEGMIGPMSFSEENRLTPFRADYNAISFVSDSYMYLGGAHGMYGYSGISYDPVTGKELSFKDVVKNTEEFEKLCAGQLSINYPESFNYYEDEGFGSRQEYIADLIHPFFAGDTVSWLLGYEGVTVFWLPYDIGSYAEGEFTCTVFFKDHPELFEEKYTDVPSAYMVPAPGEDRAIFGIAGKQEFAVVGVPTDFQYQLMYRDEAYPVEGLKEFPFEIYCSSYDYRMVMLNGVRYLLLNTFFESDDSLIMVFRMKEDGALELVQSLGEAGFWFEHYIDDSGIMGDSKVYDPLSIMLYMRNDMLGTTFGINTYVMNDNGELTALSPISGNTGDEREYTLLRDTEFKTVPAGIVGKSEFELLDDEVIIDAGQCLFLKGFYKDNGLIFSHGDDDASWYYVETAREGWQVLVNGVPAVEVFDGIVYAD